MAASLTDMFNLPQVIQGLAEDLKARRAGSISIEDCKARAEMAKQIFNGLRLIITARKFLEAEMKEVGQLTHRKAK